MDSRHRQKGWRDEETMEDAAKRLLAELEQRVEKRRLAGGHVRPAEIADRPLSPDENAEDGSHRGSGRLDRPPHTVVAREEADNGMGADGVKVVEGPDDVLKRPSANQRRFDPKQFHDSELAVRGQRFGNVRWEGK